MAESGFLATQEAARRVHPYFARRISESEDDGAFLPDIATMERMLDVAFWASLRREEGYTPLISLAYADPSQAGRHMSFERRLPLSAPVLTRLAPAVERPGIHLGVWQHQGDLAVWGATRRLPPYCFVIEVIAPGQLLIKASRAEEAGKFTNVAVLEGDLIKVIDQTPAIPDCPALLTALLGLQSQGSKEFRVQVLIQLAVSMRAHGRGGSLLVVPSGSAQWQQSILQPIAYSVKPAFSALKDLMNGAAGEPSLPSTQDAIRRAVDGIAGLTAVDGATIITEDCDLLAFGAKIIRADGGEQVTQVIATEPIEGSEAAITEPGALGGTRHLSAAQFVRDQRDSIALIASQDGHFTVFGWSSCEEMVHAHRLETLLL